MKKRLFSCIATVAAMLVLGSVTVLAAPADRFDDVLEDAWYVEDINYVIQNNLMNGMSDTFFGPDDLMTRGQFVAMLGRLVGVEDASITDPQKTVFNDVNATDYYASHVAWASELGIVKGIDETSFAPNANVTREQMAALVARFSKLSRVYLPTEASNFADDAFIADYAREAVYGMKSVGILQGVGDNYFAPRGYTSRAAAAKVVRCYMEYEPVDTAVISIEKFTLGQGYILIPSVVPLEDHATVDSVLHQVSSECGISLKFNTSYGYLTYVEDRENTILDIPAFILEEMAKSQTNLGDRTNETFLGEYDYTPQAGWLYWVNNTPASVSANEYFIGDCDVVRFQFSLYGYGADLGRADDWTIPYQTSADKDELMMAVAWANDSDDDAYTHALEVLTDLESTQDEVDAALQALPSLK